MSYAENRLRAVPSAVRPHQSPARRVGLSQLRKLREYEQVAAVCYRVRGAGIEFLLIRTRGSRRWTFPKGSTEPGLTHAQAAALEAFEEAGVHGRIEEAAFAQYIRRKQGTGRKSSRRSASKEFAVTAHLCEVLRLSDPKESNRNRTWFSAADAKLRLQEGREHDDGREFTRVIDRAVTLIQQLRGEACIVDGRSQRELVRQYPVRGDTQQRDALQTVEFEPSMQARGHAQEAAFMAYIRWQRSEVRQSAVAVDARQGEVVQGEILQFSQPRRKKAKVLATRNY
ncbi:MAG: NUDIX domain-containing protein [Candidatus Sulfotelmatobacter sp.]